MNIQSFSTCFSEMTFPIPLLNLKGNIALSQIVLKNISFPRNARIYFLIKTKTYQTFTTKQLRLNRIITYIAFYFAFYFLKALP